MTDDKAVEIMARGLCVANGYDPDKPDEEMQGPLWLVWKDDALAALAALRAEGAEVVWWTDAIETLSARLHDAEHYESVIGLPVMISGGGNVCILRGPEVQK